MNQQGSAVIIGVGPEHGLGATLAKQFSEEGLHIFIAGRSEAKLQTVADSILHNGGKVTTVVADATKEDDVNLLFEIINKSNTALQIAVYNVDSNIPAPILETEMETFIHLWSKIVLGLFCLPNRPLVA